MNPVDREFYVKMAVCGNIPHEAAYLPYIQTHQVLQSIIEDAVEYINDQIHGHITQTYIRVNLQEFEVRELSRNP
jgi:hypothetical protein